MVDLVIEMQNIQLKHSTVLNGGKAVPCTIQAKSMNKSLTIQLIISCFNSRSTHIYLLSFCSCKIKTFFLAIFRNVNYSQLIMIN